MYVAEAIVTRRAHGRAPELLEGLGTTGKGGGKGKRKGTAIDETDSRSGGAMESCPLRCRTERIGNLFLVIERLLI